MCHRSRSLVACPLKSSRNGELQVRIILVNKFHYHRGGSETYYFALAEQLRSLGHEVFFFSMTDPRNLPCDQVRFFVSSKEYVNETSVIAKVNAARTLVYSPESKRKFQELCAQVRPDIIHMNLVHRQITLSILDAPYLREHRVPVLFTAHDYILICPNCTMLDGSGAVCDACSGGHFMSCIRHRCVKDSFAKSALAFLEAEFYRCRRTYQRIDRIIAPSRFLAEKTIGAGFPRSQVITMQNFIPDADLREIEAAPEPVGKPYLLYFGRLSKEKGVDILLRAYSSYRKAVEKPLELKIVGDGSQRGELEVLSGELGISDHLEFLGFQKGVNLRSIVKGAHFAIVPSVWCENMPFSIVESMAAGTPVIGSDLGGIPDLIEDGVNGLLFHARNEESLVDTLLRVASMGSDAYASMQSAARAYVAAHCDQSKYMNELVSLYRDLIQEKKGN